MTTSKSYSLQTLALVTALSLLVSGLAGFWRWGADTSEATAHAVNDVRIESNAAAIEKLAGAVGELTKSHAVFLSGLSSLTAKLDAYLSRGDGGPD